MVGSRGGSTGPGSPSSNRLGWSGRPPGAGSGAGSTADASTGSAGQSGAPSSVRAVAATAPGPAGRGQGRGPLGLPLVERRWRARYRGRIDGQWDRVAAEVGQVVEEDAHAGEEDLGVGAAAVLGRRVLAVDPVERHDEVIAGAGAGDVQQPEALVVAHLLVDRDGGLELLGDDLLAHAVAHRAAVPGEVHLHRAAHPAGTGRQAATRS